MAVRFIDLRPAPNGNQFTYPLERAVVVPGEDVIIGRSPRGINIFPEYLDKALSEITVPGEWEIPRHEQIRRTSNLEEMGEYYRSCSREHLAYSPPKRAIRDLNSKNGTFLQRAKRDDKDNPTKEHEEREKLSPWVYVGVKNGDIIYAGRVVLLFEDKED